MKKILILAANPNGTTRIRLDQEVRDIEEGLRRSQYREEFELIQRWAVRPRDILRAMLDEEPQIIHFSGHGEGEEGLVFEDSEGNTQLIQGEAIANLFNLFSHHVECVLLNGCYSKIQAEAIVHHIDYVIGMSRAISDLAAIEFAVAFYDTLGAGRDYKFAFRLACTAIQLSATSISQGFTRKLTTVDPVAETSSEHLIPILLEKSSLAKTPNFTLSNLEAEKLERQLDCELLEANLQAVEVAGQARIESLNQRISEEENKLQASLTDHIKEALDWLKKNQKNLSEYAKNDALSKHPSIFEGLSLEEQDDFRWQIEKYIESVYFSMLSGTFTLLDEPAINPCINSFEAYQTAFSLIKKRIPARLQPEARQILFDRFEYLLNRLFV